MIIAVQDIPHINAILNSISVVFLLFGLLRGAGVVMFVYVFCCSWQAGISRSCLCPLFVFGECGIMRK